jgi:hypothetical protein
VLASADTLFVVKKSDIRKGRVPKAGQFLTGLPPGSGMDDVAEELLFSDGPLLRNRSNSPGEERDSTAHPKNLEEHE